MKRNQIIGAIIGIVVVGGAGFWGGMAYANSQTPARESLAGGTFTRGAGGAGGAFAGRTGAGGGITAGQIVSSGNGSITIQAATGSSTQLVLVGNSTQILKTAAGSMSDLSVGAAVTVTGTSNSDGSLSAQTIQIRPAGMNFGGRSGSSQTSTQTGQ